MDAIVPEAAVIVRLRVKARKRVSNKQQRDLAVAGKAECLVIFNAWKVYESLRIHGHPSGHYRTQWKSAMRLLLLSLLHTLARVDYKCTTLLPLRLPLTITITLTLTEM